jgi:hypothetical protein
MRDVQVVHAIPGRIRLRIARIRNDPALAADVEGRLARIEGVRQVEANPVTGSVLVVFKARDTMNEDPLSFLAATWPAELGSLEEHGANGGTTNGSGTPPAVDRRIVQFFGSLNSGVGQVTSGFDLRVLVPLTLFALGVRSLIFSEKLPFPAWYDFFWFGLSTFVMLNGAVIEDGREPPGRLPSPA